MKKFLLFSAAILCALPLFGQKLTKEEKKALEKQAHDAAVEAIQAKAFVLVPTSYQTSDGNVESLNDNGIFISAEGENMYSYGWAVCGNSYNNIGTPTEYNVDVDKKGKVKAIITVSGRHWRGTYTIKMGKDNNIADVIFNQPNKPSMRFTGPIVPLAGADYFRRSNPM